MDVKKIELVNFRNYKNLSVEFDHGLNIIFGNNAQGKTNILEGIYITSTGRSFRTQNDGDLIQTGYDKYRVSLICADNDRDLVIQRISLLGNKKEIRLNGVPIKNYAELIGRIHAIVFTPDDLRLIKDGPAERRKFIDREMSLMSKMYYHNLLAYNRVLKQRNQILKTRKSIDILKTSLEPWDHQLCQYGSYLVGARKKFIDLISVNAEKVHAKISGKSEVLKIQYIPNPNTLNMSNYDTIFSGIKNQLEKNLSYDIYRGTTGTGPHRDDLFFFVNGNKLQDFGSQGQMRSAALSLKLSEIEVIKANSSITPIILLDDVMSELDIQRQNQLLRELDNLQVFITATDLNGLDQSIVDSARLYHVVDGAIVFYSV